MVRFKTLCPLVLVFVLLETNLPAFAQNTPIPVEDWIKKLNAENDSNNENFWTINETLYHCDSIGVSGALKELEKSFTSASLFLKHAFTA